MIDCREIIDYPNSFYAKERHHFPFRKLNYVIKEELQNKIKNISNYEYITNNSRNRYLELKNKFESTISNLLTSL
jgi:uncharacterized protein YlbG (UPF0298 family)